jgi:hypothetical protein
MAFDQAKRIDLTTKHVILAGLLNNKTLCQNMLRQQLTIEVHDRDKKGFYDLESTTRQFVEDDFSVFGVASICTSPVFNVTIALSDFVLEPKNLSLKFTVPVLPASDVESPSAHISSIQPGLWLQAKTVMKLKVDLSRPLMNDTEFHQFLEQNREDLLHLQQEADRKELKSGSNKLSNARQFITGPYSRAILVIECVRRN